MGRPLAYHEFFSAPYQGSYYFYHKISLAKNDMGSDPRPKKLKVYNFRFFTKSTKYCFCIGKIPNLRIPIVGIVHGFELRICIQHGNPRFSPIVFYQLSAETEPSALFHSTNLYPIVNR